MAVRVFQLCVVFTVVRLASATEDAVVKEGVDFQPPFRLMDLDDVLVARGQSVILTCKVEAVESAESYEYKWFFNGSAISENDTRRQLLENGSLHIPKILNGWHSLEGGYQCFVSIKGRPGGLLSNSAKLKVATLPHKFIRQPYDFNVTEKQPAVIPCYIESTPKAIVHWEKDNLPLPQDKRYVPLPSGALLITSISTTDVGSYRCIAENKHLKRSKRSERGRISVGGIFGDDDDEEAKNPHFLQLGMSRNFMTPVGGNLTLYCIVSGWPLPTVKWLNSFNVVVGNKSTLDLRNMTVAQSGNYTCTALNSRGHISQQYYVEVQEKPAFKEVPVSKRYPNSQTIRLNCTASGHPKPKIFWLKNGKRFNTDARLKHSSNGIVFSHSFVSDEGFYQCIATNSAATISADAYLLCNSTNIPEAPKNVQCLPFDDHNICVKWQGTENDTAYTIHAVETNADLLLADEVAIDKHYMITNLKANANYTVYVRSYVSSASESSDQVTCVTGVQGNRNLTLQKIEQNSLLVTWAKVSTDVECGGTNYTYKLYWKRMNSKGSHVKTVSGFTEVLSGFEAGETYQFKILSANAQDKTNQWISFVYSEDGNSTTLHITAIDRNKNNAKVLPPHFIVIVNVTSTSIYLTWKDKNPHVTYFSVCYFEARKREDCEDDDDVKTNTSSLLLKGLKSNTDFEIKIRTCTKDGISLYSETVEIRTLADVPIKVQHLKYSIYNDTSVCVIWGPPLYKSGSVVFYSISYTPDQNWPLESWYNFTVQRSSQFCSQEDKSVSALLHGLDSHFNYTLIVRAANSVGLGNPSVITVNTKLQLYNSYNNRPGRENGKRILSSEEDSYSGYKVGIVIGLVVVIWIIVTFGILLLRRRCVKRQALARARRNINKTILTENSTNPSSNVLQLRSLDPCAPDAHERQQLVGENSVLPTIEPASNTDKKNDKNHLNKQPVNGVKPHLTNGHVSSIGNNYRITENPQFYMPICNGQSSLLNGHTNEDSNSNIPAVTCNEIGKLYKLSKVKNNKPFLGGRFSSKSIGNCLKYADDTPDDSMENDDVHNDTTETILDDSVDSARLSCANITMLKVPSIHEIMPPALSPNG